MMTDIDTSVLESLRSEGQALADAISKHLDAHPKYPRRLIDKLNLLWSAVDIAVNEMGCTRCEHERVGIVDNGLDGFWCAECAEKMAA